MSADTIIFLVPDDDIADSLRRALAVRYRAASDGMKLEIVRGPADHQISEARTRHGGSPLGYVAMDEASALEALRHGADEAIAWPPQNEQAIQGFWDRTLLRASLRREQAELRASVVHQEKLAALGTLVAGVAHEINNPLTSLQLCMDACAALPAPAVGQECRALLEEMKVASGAIADIVRDLRIFARSDDGRERPQLVDVADLVDQALRIVRREFEPNAYVERDYSPEAGKVLVPAARLTQVLINTLVNAAQAMREIARPSHHVRISTRSDEQHVAITITDTGPGIAPEVLDYIFDPFFTTKRAGTGTGLGLSISRSIMRDLGGDLLVTSVHGEGATFILLLPLPDAAAIRKAMRDSVTSVAATHHRERPSVLFVDGDVGVLRAYARAFGKSCNAVFAEDAGEAIALLSSGSAPDAIVTELDLPEIDGAHLYDWIRRERPSLALRTIFVTAASITDKYQSFLAATGSPPLFKPVNAQTLFEAITAAARTSSHSHE